MNRPIVILLALLAVAFPLSLLAGRVWIDPAATPNAAVILAYGLGALVSPTAFGAAMDFMRRPQADAQLYHIEDMV